MLKKRSKNDNFGDLLGERILVKNLWRCGRWVISCTESASLRSGRNCREMVPLSAGSLTSLLDSSISANSIRLISCFWSISISLFSPDSIEILNCEFLQSFLCFDCCYANIIRFYHNDCNNIAGSINTGSFFLEF